MFPNEKDASKKLYKFSNVFMRLSIFGFDVLAAKGHMVIGCTYPYELKRSGLRRSCGNLCNWRQNKSVIGSSKSTFEFAYKSVIGSRSTFDSQIPLITLPQTVY